jgi:aminopeptidase S
MRLFIAAAAAAATAMAACSAPTGPPATNLLQRQLEAATSGTGSLAHLRKLQRIADQNGGNRASPGLGTTQASTT